MGFFATILIKGVFWDTSYEILVSQRTQVRNQKGGGGMKGYDTDSGYMGYVDGSYILFASESEYLEYTRE